MFFKVKMKKFKSIKLKFDINFEAKISYCTFFCNCVSNVFIFVKYCKILTLFEFFIFE